MQEIKNAPNELDEDSVLEHFKYTTIDIDSNNSVENNELSAENTSCSKSRETNNYLPVIQPSPYVSKDPISFLTKMVYSIPSFSKMSCLLILNVNALIFYETKGASLLLISFFTALARCVELFMKPIIAFSSDNATFKLGRRKPYMFFGCVFYAVFLVLIFSPLSEISVVGISLWFGIFYVLFFLADTIVMIPYFALGPELSSDPKEREKLYIFVYTFQYIGVLLTSIGPVIIQKFTNFCDCSYCVHRNDPTEQAQCITSCQSECGVNSNEKSLLYMCMGIGFIFVCSIIFLATNIIEKKKSFKSEEQNYIIPTLYRMKANKPFINLLLPYIFDTLITQIFATMLPFFITYIINPMKYCKQNNIDITNQNCNGNTWLGITMFSFFVASLISIISWHFYVGLIGKKKAWQSYSIMCIFTFSLFLFCDVGHTYLLICLCVLNSVPAGGAYLNDVLLTDTIDYDEFISGKRNEGIYIVVSVFVPKIVGIAAQSIPLTIMSLIGFIPSNKGAIYEQPKGVIEFIRFYFIGLPILLSIVSFYLKTRYPIDDPQMDKLSKSISIQNSRVEELKEMYDFYKIPNPIYDNEEIQIFTKSPLQVQTQFVAEHFLDEEYLENLTRLDFQAVRKSKLIILSIWLGVFAIFAFVLGMTFKYLEVTSMNLFPLFSLIIITIAVCFIILNIIQLCLICKCIKGDYQIDQKLMKLFLFKERKQLQKEASKSEEGLKNECNSLSNDCKKNK